MTFHSHEGILLSKTAYRDGDLILSCLTSLGTQRYIARSARQSRKRFAGQLDYFRRLSLICQAPSEKELLPLRSCELVEVWEPLWQDPDRYRLGCRWITLLRQLLPPGKGRSIYRFVCDSLRYLACHGASREIAVRFELRLSMHLGYGPNVESGSVGDHRWLSSDTRLWLAEYQRFGRVSAGLNESQLSEIKSLLDNNWKTLEVSL